MLKNEPNDQSYVVSLIVCRKQNCIFRLLCACVFHSPEAATEGGSETLTLKFVQAFIALPVWSTVHFGKRAQLMTWSYATESSHRVCLSSHSIPASLGRFRWWALVSNYSHTSFVLMWEAQVLHQTEEPLIIARIIRAIGHSQEYTDLWTISQEDSLRCNLHQGSCKVWLTRFEFHNHNQS